MELTVKGTAAQQRSTRLKQPKESIRSHEVPRHYIVSREVGLIVVEPDTVRRPVFRGPAQHSDDMKPHIPTSSWLPVSDEIEGSQSEPSFVAASKEGSFQDNEVLRWCVLAWSLCLDQRCCRSSVIITMDVATDSRALVRILIGITHFHRISNFSLCAILTNPLQI